MAVKRSRKFSLVSYCTPDFILSALQSHERSIRGYALATHNKDKNDDGTLKESHTHIVLWLYDARTVDDVRRWFRCVDVTGIEVNTLGQICLDVVAAFEYLTHKNTPGKYKYADDIVICTDESLFNGLSDVYEDTAVGALQELINGVPLKEVAFRYGRDFIFHYSHIKLLIDDILRSGVGDG